MLILGGTARTQGGAGTGWFLVFTVWRSPPSAPRRDFRHLCFTKKPDPAREERMRASAARVGATVSPDVSFPRSVPRNQKSRVCQIARSQRVREAVHAAACGRIGPQHRASENNQSPASCATHTDFWLGSAQCEQPPPLSRAVLPGMLTRGCLSDVLPTWLVSSAPSGPVWLCQKVAQVGSWVQGSSARCP